MDPDRAKQLAFAKRIIVGYVTVHRGGYMDENMMRVQEHPDAHLKPMEDGLVDLLLCETHGQSAYQILERAAVHLMTVAERARRMES